MNLVPLVWVHPTLRSSLDLCACALRTPLRISSGCKVFACSARQILLHRLLHESKRYADPTMELPLRLKSHWLLLSTRSLIQPLNLQCASLCRSQALKADYSMDTMASSKHQPKE